MAWNFCLGCFYPSCALLMLQNTHTRTHINTHSYLPFIINLFLNFTNFTLNQYKLLFFLFKKNNFPLNWIKDPCFTFPHPLFMAYSACNPKFLLPLPFSFIGDISPHMNMWNHMKKTLFSLFFILSLYFSSMSPNRTQTKISMRVFMSKVLKSSLKKLTVAGKIESFNQPFLKLLGNYCLIF